MNATLFNQIYAQSAQDWTNLNRLYAIIAAAPSMTVPYAAYLNRTIWDQPTPAFLAMDWFARAASLRTPAEHAATVAEFATYPNGFFLKSYWDRAARELGFFNWSALYAYTIAPPQGVTLGQDRLDELNRAKAECEDIQFQNYGLCINITNAGLGMGNADYDAYVEAGVTANLARGLPLRLAMRTLIMPYMYTIYIDDIYAMTMGAAYQAPVQAALTALAQSLGFASLAALRTHKEAGVLP